MARAILLKPVLTEKSDKLSNKRAQYTFIVDKKANKIEIAKAVANLYNVTIESVNTLVMPAKAKSRNTKTSILRGRVSSFKKAIVTLASGETIDYFGGNEE